MSSVQIRLGVCDLCTFRHPSKRNCGDPDPLGRRARRCKKKMYCIRARSMRPHTSGQAESMHSHSIGERTLGKSQPGSGERHPKMSLILRIFRATHLHTRTHMTCVSCVPVHSLTSHGHSTIYNTIHAPEAADCVRANDRIRQSHLRITSNSTISEKHAYK